MAVKGYGNIKKQPYLKTNPYIKKQPPGGGCFFNVGLFFKVGLFFNVVHSFLQPSFLNPFYGFYMFLRHTCLS